MKKYPSIKFTNSTLSPKFRVSRDFKNLSLLYPSTVYFGTPGNPRASLGMSVIITITTPTPAVPAINGKNSKIQNYLIIDIILINITPGK